MHKRFLNKQTIIKLIISVVLLTLAIVTISIINNINKNNAISKDIGTITIEIVPLEKDKIERSIAYKEGSTVWDIVKANFTVRYDESSYGIVLYDIDEVKTDFKTSYIAIYVDDEYSNVGISSIVIRDGMVISFRETKI